MLTAADVAQIGVAAAEVRIWHSTAELSIDDRMMTAFAELQKDDNTARVRRVLWAVIAALVAAAATLQAGTALLTGLLPALLTP